MVPSPQHWTWSAQMDLETSMPLWLIWPSALVLVELADPGIFICSCCSQNQVGSPEMTVLDLCYQIQLTQMDPGTSAQHKVDTESLWASCSPESLVLGLNIRLPSTQMDLVTSTILASDSLESRSALLAQTKHSTKTDARTSLPLMPSRIWIYSARLTWLGLKSFPGEQGCEVTFLLSQHQIIPMLYGHLSLLCI